MHAVGEQVSTCWAPLFYRHARNGKGEGDVKASLFAPNKVLISKFVYFQHRYKILYQYYYY